MERVQQPPEVDDGHRDPGNADGSDLDTTENVLDSPQVLGRECTGIGVQPSCTDDCVLLQFKPPAPQLGHARQNSNTTRQIPSSNYGKSVGPGTRPPSAIGRPQNPTSLSKSVSAHSRAPGRSRPATAMGFHEDETPGSKLQNGTMRATNFFRSSSQSSSDVIQGRRCRGAQSAQAVRSGLPTPKARQSSVGSLTRRMSRLNLKDSIRNDKACNGNQAVSKKENYALGQPDQPNAIPEQATARKDRRAEVDAVPTSPNKLPRAVSKEPPSTPLRQTRDVPAAFAKFETAWKDLKTPRTPAMSPSPTKSHQPFLTKDSNTRGFAAWDVDERLLVFESQVKELKDVVNGSINDRKSMEDAIDRATTRCKAIARDLACSFGHS